MGVTLFFLLSVVGLCDEAWMTEKGHDKVIHAQRERSKESERERKGDRRLVQKERQGKEQR